MWNLKINKFIKENHLFYFLLRNHKKARKILKYYNKEYSDLCFEVENYLKKITVESNEKYAVSYLFDISKDDLSLCSPYREDVYSIFYKDKINIFKASRNFIFLPEERGEEKIHIGKTEKPLNDIFKESSDFWEGRLLYIEMKNFIYGTIESVDVVNALRDAIFEEFRTVDNLYDLVKRYPFLIKYFPESYLKRERQWMKENLSNYPIPTSEEAELFEINLL